MKIKTSVVIFFLLTGMVFGTKIIPLPEVMRPSPDFSPLSVNDKYIYITDGLSILLYSQKDFKLKKKFGKLGEGPQEFQGYDTPRSVFTSIDSENILVDSNGKISFYTLDGEYIKQMRILAGKSVKTFDDHFVTYWYHRPGKSISGTVNIHDGKFEIVKELMRFPEFMLQEKLNPLGFRRPQPFIYKHKLYLNSLEDGSIHVYDKTGKQLQVIKYQNQRLPITDAIKAEVIHVFKTDPRLKDIYDEYIKPRMEFKSHCPFIKIYQISQDKIYILTWKMSEDRKKSEFIVLGVNGKFIKKMMFPVAHYNVAEPFPLCIHKGKLYQVVENEKAEEWELHITDIK